MNEAQQIMTGGEFATEPEAVEFLDRAVKSSGAFKSYSEVKGFVVQPRCGCEQSTTRIDRILVPTQKLIEAGWEHGPIGIECKKSGHKVGKVISQAMDYSRCAFELPHGFTIMLNWIFIWPLERATGDLESLMAQNRIGYVRSFSRTPLVFSCGGMHAIVVYYDGTIEAKKLPMGNKVGSR